MLVSREILLSPFFFFNHTATTETYTLSLHAALPISPRRCRRAAPRHRPAAAPRARRSRAAALQLAYAAAQRSEEHTSELQSQSNLVCRLLLEKKKKGKNLEKFVKDPVLCNSAAALES